MASSGSTVLSPTTRDAVLNVLYSNLQNVIVECISQNTSLLISVTQETPEVVAVPGASKVSIAGNVHVINLSDDVCKILKGEEVEIAGMLGGDSISNNDERCVEFKREVGLKNDPLERLEENPYCSCEFCGTVFDSKCKAIMNAVSTDAKSPSKKKSQVTPKRKKYNLKRAEKMECPVCQKIIARQSYYEHVDAHYGNRYTCKLCNKSFTRKQSLERHCKDHFRKKTKVKCQYCDKLYPNTGALNVHVRTSHLKNPNFKCSQCDRTFYFDYLLKEHIRMHTGEKPCVCNTCGKRFRTKKNLNLHEAIHKEGYTPKKKKKRRTKLNSDNGLSDDLDEQQ